MAETQKKRTRRKRDPKLTDLATVSTPLPEAGVDRVPTLTLQQEMFCQYFVSETEFYGNGIQSYSRAYDEPINAFNYEAIKARAARLLMTPLIMKRISALLVEDGFNDANADKHLLFLITQSVDLRSKLGAVKEYNKLKARITEKIQLEMPVARINILPAKPRQIAAPAEVVEHGNGTDS